ncbi:MAG: TIR domain-containing protein, partial [Proteobacteria bacterium]|nr:TIR domain-containing protein [Pseudomonadota bacterium]
MGSVDAMPKIFLSYAREQESQVEKVAVRLRDRGFTVFFDQHSLSGGAPLDDVFKQKVLSCDIFVFFVSPDSVKEGSFALTELYWAKERWPRPAGHVLPVMAVHTEIEQIDPYITELLHIAAFRTNFAVGVCDEIEKLVENAPGDQSRTEDLSVAECSAHLVDALSKRRRLPPTGTATDDVRKQIDSLVRSIKGAFRPDEGSVVAGAKLLKVVGTGNFGTVWEAVDIATQERVAVKIFRLERLAEGQML